MELDGVREPFFAETEELLDDMEQALQCLVRGIDPEHIHCLFRAAHTIKGNSRIFPCPHIERFAHRFEEGLEALRAGRVALNPPVVALLQEAHEHLAALVVDAAEGTEPSSATLKRGTELGNALAGLAGDTGRTGAVAAHEEGYPARWRVEWGIGPHVARGGHDPLAVLRYLRSQGCIEGLRLGGGLPALAQLEPERCYLSLNFDYLSDLSLTGIRRPFESFLDQSTLTITHAEASRVTDDHAPQGNEQAPVPSAVAASSPRVPGRGKVAKRDAVVRVDAARLEQLVSLVGELVIANAASSALTCRLGNEQLAASNSNVTRLVEEIRDSALTLRMVPMAATFNRFPHLVAEMARELGKDVELRLAGGDVELDKMVVEKVADPLMHLVRNAIDHGIEAPVDRRRAGKATKGRVTIAAATQSGSVIITVTDDGQGIDVPKLLAKARSAGLVPPDHAPGDAEILRLAFEPGMSTADRVSHYSGRGVGLDAVKRKVESLRGTVELESVPGQGTLVSIRLPLSLSIIDGFRVGVSGVSYVLPLDAVVECIELEPGFMSGDGRYINLRNEVLPFIRLRELFGEPMRDGEVRENIVVVGHGGQKTGLVVDQLFGEYQTVVKPLGRLFGNVPGLSGATILGSGDVALILDVPQLVHAATQKPVAIPRGRTAGHPLPGRTAHAQSSARVLALEV